MAGTRFEQLIERELRNNADKMFAVPIGDSHQHALVKGIRLGLEMAQSHFQRVLKESGSDDEE